MLDLGPKAGYGFAALRAWNADEARVPQTHSLGCGGGIYAIPPGHLVRISARI
jgi:hypothetical protein